MYSLTLEPPCQCDSLSSRGAGINTFATVLMSAALRTIERKNEIYWKTILVCAKSTEKHFVVEIPIGVNHVGPGESGISSPDGKCDYSNRAKRTTVTARMEHSSGDDTLEGTMCG